MASTIAAAWARIVAWLEENAPETLEGFEPAATGEEIAQAAEAMGVTFPDELVEFYGLTSGAEGCGIFPSLSDFDLMAFSPVTLDEVVSQWSMQKELLDSGEYARNVAKADPGVADTWWNAGWIPIANNGGGDNYCIDTAPTPEGQVGQVISHSHENGKRTILARSLGEYLTKLADQLDRNELLFDEDYGIRVRQPEEVLD